MGAMQTPAPCQPWPPGPGSKLGSRELQALQAATSTEVAIARKEYRLQQLQDRHTRLQQVITGREKFFNDAVTKELLKPADERRPVLAGSVTGLIDPETRQIDRHLLKELREIEQQAAIEVGQWDQPVEKANPGEQVTGTLEELLIQYRRVQTEVSK